jgi:dipeptidyl aminopeptidase/acylaminoacyl peptidase
MRFSPRSAVLTCFSLWLACPGIAAPRFEERVAALYRPLQAEAVALSPDGAHVAFTRHERDELVIYLMAVEKTEPKFKIIVEGDRPVAFSKERAPARLRFLRWASPTRVVFAPTPYNNGVRYVAPIMAANLDGTEAKTLVTQDDFDVSVEPAFMSDGSPLPPRPPITRPTRIVGFEAGNRNALLVEALGHITWPPLPVVPTGLFSVNVHTGKMTPVSEEPGDGRYLYDRIGRARVVYREPELAHKRTFAYQGVGTWSRWTEMNEAWGGPLAGSFVVSVENYFGERAFPVGFGSDPDRLYYASSIGRDTLALYALDVRTKQRVDFALEDPHVDLLPLDPAVARGALVFDELRGDLLGVRALGLEPFTHWIDADFARLQQELERKFPQRTVEIVEWSDTRTRFLIRVTGGIEPGRYHVFLQPENVLVEVERRAPWLRNTDLHPGATCEFDTPEGVHLTGYLTFPRQSRINPPPVVVVFSAAPTTRAWPGFDREAQLLADMGFIVMRLNHRGTAGFGVKHRNAVRSAIDRAPVDDALAAIEWLARHYAIDRRRVATFGHGLGGYLAVRALQLEPDAFRCGIAIQAPLDPNRWLQPPVDDAGLTLASTPTIRMGPQPMRRPRPINFLKEAQLAFFTVGSSSLAQASALRSANQVTKPVMLIVDPPQDRLIDAQNDELRSKLKRAGTAVDYLEVDSGFAERLPGAQAKVFRRIEEFFNLNVYDYNVKVGPAKEVK